MVSNRLERRLAAILAADMVGYSRLMEIDEAGTIARQRSHRETLIDPAIVAFNGRVVKTTGDGLLVEFASAVDAIECAIDVQKAMDEREADQPDDRRIRYRIGVNVGDIVIDGDDILGDGVNIAARLEGLAVPGGIAISANAYEQTQGELRALFQDSGDHKVKNLTRPLRVWQWPAGEGAGSPNPNTANKADQTLAAILSRIEQPTIAVLPFTNMSRNEELEFFCDGLAESLITDLSRGTRLSVAARNSSFALKGQSLDLRDAAKKLGVRYLVEGSVQSMGSRMRVNAQLIDTVTGDHVWADRFDRSIEDLFSVQDELCDAILIEADTALSTGDQTRIQSAQSQNVQAMFHLRRAVVHFSANDSRGYFKALEESEKAFAIDPNIRTALVYRVSTRAHLVLNKWVTDGDKWLDEAMEIADAAIERGENTYSSSSHGGLYLARGMIFLAKGAFDQSIKDSIFGAELTPNIPPARHMYARSLIGSGRFSEAYREAMAAIRLQPNPAPFMLVTLGIACLMGDRPADAVQALRKYRELAPNLAPGAALYAGALAAVDQVDQARSVIADVQHLDPTLSVDDVLRPYPTKDPAHQEKLAAYLETAGLRR